MSLEVSVSDGISRQLQILGIKMEEEVRKAMTLAGMAGIDDAINKAPTPPVLTGNLRGSWFVYAGRKLVASGSDSKAPNTIEANKFSFAIGFNAKYAMRQHENLDPAGPMQPGPVSQQAGDVGGKFLESKLLTYAGRYAGIAADSLRKDLPNAVKRAALDGGVRIIGKVFKAL